jgi:hypothetical protein
MSHILEAWRRFKCFTSDRYFQFQIERENNVTTLHGQHGSIARKMDAKLEINRSREEIVDIDTALPYLSKDGSLLADHCRSGKHSYTNYHVAKSYSSYIVSLNFQFK